MTLNFPIFFIVYSEKKKTENETKVLFTRMYDTLSVYRRELEHDNIGEMCLNKHKDSYSI